MSNKHKWIHTMKYTRKKVIVFVFLLSLCCSQNVFAGEVDPLGEILFYKDLLNYTCQLQINYYNEFSKYLEKTKAPHTPKLINYFLGISYFENGDYKNASKRLSEFTKHSGIGDYNIFANIMLEVIKFKQGKIKDLSYKELMEKPVSKKVKAFMGYALLRFTKENKLAESMLADRPKKFFSEVKEKWINFILNGGGKIKLVPYRLKRPDYVEEYDTIKLKTETIPLLIKYFDPANIALLRDIAWKKAVRRLRGKNINNMINLARLELERSGFVNYDKASRYLKQFLGVQPGNSKAHIYLGKTSYLKGDTVGAAEAWKYVRENGDKSSIRELAITLSELGMGEDALLLMERSKDAGINDMPSDDIRYFLKYKGYYRSLGRIYLRMRDYGMAGKMLMLTYQRSMSGNPHFFERGYLLRLGFSLSRLGRYKEAIKFALKGVSSVNPACYSLFHTVNFGLYMLNHE